MPLPTDVARLTLGHNALGFGALLLIAAAFGVVAHGESGTDCARTPLVLAPDAKGVSLHEVRQDVARDYATRTRYVTSEPDGTAAVEMSVWDASGDFFHGKVRVVRAPSGVGWLQATANTCGD
jgi:hypothetical protein